MSMPHGLPAGHQQTYDAARVAAAHAEAAAARQAKRDYRTELLNKQHAKASRSPTDGENEATPAARTTGSIANGSAIYDMWHGDSDQRRELLDGRATPSSKDGGE